VLAYRLCQPNDLTWLRLLTCKTASQITYTVLVETLNPAQSINHFHCSSNHVTLLLLSTFCEVRRSSWCDEVVCSVISGVTRLVTAATCSNMVRQLAQQMSFAASEKVNRLSALNMTLFCIELVHSVLDYHMMHYNMVWYLFVVKIVHEVHSSMIGLLVSK